MLGFSRTACHCRRGAEQRVLRGSLRTLACCFPPNPAIAARPCRRYRATVIHRAASRAGCLQVKDLPRGLSPEPTSLVNEPDVLLAYPTVIQQARNNMQKLSNCIILTRVGSFYELYFEQATRYAPLLNIKLASKKTNAGPVPMAGFPFFQLDRFLRVLVQELHQSVAIAEEKPNDPAQRVKMGGLMWDRHIERIVTPGTLIDESFLSPYDHNYLLAIHLPDSREYTNSMTLGLSWLDLSSGDFFTQAAPMTTLGAAIARIRPQEIVLRGELQTSLPHMIEEALLESDKTTISYHHATGDIKSVEDWAPMLEGAISSLQAGDFTNEETLAGTLLLQYVQDQLPEMKLRLRPPVRQQSGDYVQIDKNSLRGLEVVQTLRERLHKGSLLHAVKRTATESGARLLARRLTAPSTSLIQIEERLDLVQIFVSDADLLENIFELLRRSSDTLRLVQKFAFGRGDADGLLALAATIRLTRELGTVLEESAGVESSCLKNLLNRFQWLAPEKLADHIDNAIDQDGLYLRQSSIEASTVEAEGLARAALESEPDADDLQGLRKRLAERKAAVSQESAARESDEMWIMKKTASDILSKLHDELDNLHWKKGQLNDALRETLKASSLSLKFTPGLGHICHIKGRDVKIDLVALDGVRVVGSTKSTKSFYLKDWTDLGLKMENTKTRIRKEEEAIFQSLRDQVIKNLIVLRRNGAALDELDVACSFARLAGDFNLTRPKLNTGTEHKVWQGRHLMVEAGLANAGRMFVANDCVLGGDKLIWMITGPNMAGKSTYLRQMALISILAQTGSFVPAEYAEIGLVDQIFSRVGSADNLAQDQSTFMVEMLETANILRNATQRSFVIMDEVGRGTTPEDGMAVGYAVLDHLHNVTKCRTLFATHFHALADMTKDFANLACYCTDVIEEEGASFRYDHRLREGVNRNSHALKVAALAGMPTSTISVAEQALRKLKE